MIEEASCGSCHHWNTEECTYGDYEGCERYADSEACVFFEDIE